MRTEQLGARWFVAYWESHREVFGPDKFVMRMTLGNGGESQQRVSPCMTTSQMTAEGELEERRSEARLRESSQSILTTLFPKIMRGDLQLS